MACCQTALSHYLHHCWFDISKVLRHSSEGDFTGKTWVTKNSLKITVISSRRQPHRWLWMHHENLGFPRHAWLGNAGSHNGLMPIRHHFYWHGITLIPAWISNHVSSKVWNEINCPFPNFNGAYKFRGIPVDESPHIFQHLILMIQ